MAKKVQRSNMVQTDAKGNVLRQPRDNASGEAVNFKWWTVENEADQAHAIAQTLLFVRRHQSTRMESLADYTRLRGNSTLLGPLGVSFTRLGATQSNPSSTQRLTYNLCSSVIETLASKHAKNKVIPTYITNGGIWKFQKRAKQLTKFAQGLAYEQKIHEKAIEMFDDAGTWGDGFLHVFRKDDKVAIERTLPHELFVDLIASLSSDPRELYRVKFMDRDVALELFPELEEQIMTVSPSSTQELGGYATSADIITVVEAWHLPSSKDAKDGLHVITIGDGVIREPYKRDYFPFPHLRYVKRKLGWYGQGACERLQNIQGEINRGLILKQRSLWMQGSFKLLVENGSKVVTEHLNNEVGAIIHYTGTLPQYVTPPATNPELQQWIDSLIQKGLDQEGVPKLVTTGEAPLGVESGKALRTLTQIGDDRFTFQSQEIESVELEIYRQAIDVVKDIYKDTGKYEVVFPSTHFMETVDWGDIQLDQDQYVLKAYPTSSLSDDFTGRLADIQEMMQAGLVSPRTGKRLMDMPDVEMYDNLANAAEDLLHKIFEDMLDDGKYTAPEPFMDLVLGKQLVLEYYNYATYMGAPAECLALLEQFNAQLGDVTGTNAQPLAAQAGVPMNAPAQPMAAPEPQPTSNLIPNTNAGVA